MRRRPVGGPIALAGIVLLAALLPGQAHAGDTIGQARANTQGAGCGGGTFIQTQSAGNGYAAPYDGVITSWTNLGFSDAMKFKVARIGTGGSFTVIGQDGPHPQANGVRTTNLVRIPVRQGDVIGYHTPSTYCIFGGGPDDAYGYSSSDPPAGATGFFDASAVSSKRLPVEAFIEHDRDNDGFGDETQDGCPTNASTQGACPLPTTLGQTLTPISSRSTATAIPARPADQRFSAPADGVITSWSYQAINLVDGTVKLKAFRPLGGDGFESLAESEPRTPAPNALNTFPTRLSVRAGDRIGIRANNLPISSNVSDSGSSWFTASDPPPGASTTFTQSNRRTNVSAVLEADADRDGYGDTTQDLCPTDPSTQGACRIIQPQPPAGDDACDKARKKLAKAKARLKKLKEADAKAEKLKKAKAKVKKAKSGVRKAC